MLHSAEGCSFASLLEISIFEDDHGCFASQLIGLATGHSIERQISYLQNHWFQIFGAHVTDNPPDSRRTSEVHPLHSRMRDHGFRDSPGILARTTNEIENAGRKTRFPEGINQ